MSSKVKDGGKKKKVTSDDISEVIVRQINNEYAEVTTKFNSQEKIIIALLFNEEEIKSIKKARSNTDYY